MSTYSRLLFPVLMLASSTTTPAVVDTSMNGSFEPAHGWILVENGGLSDVKAALRDYDGLSRAERPGVFRVELHPQTNGAVAVVLPDGLPAYDLANMTGWLSAPPDQEDVHGAASWLTAPGTGIKYYLEPETSNQWGDTLVGSSSLGPSVRVYLPETGLSEVSDSHPYRAEPEIKVSSRPVTIKVTLDTNTAFGNSKFVVNAAKDHDWHR